tara:strand:- start:6633 stop:7007 length:375 start_codon:yes stop_codon:yes gene_type:complete
MLIKLEILINRESVQHLVLDNLGLHKASESELEMFQYGDWSIDDPGLDLQLKNVLGLLELRKSLKDAMELREADQRPVASWPCEECKIPVPEDEFLGKDNRDGTSEYLCESCYVTRRENEIRLL